LIHLIEFLLYAFNIAEDSHKQFNRSKNLINSNKYTKYSFVNWVKDSGWIDKVKSYTRKADDCENEENVKQSIPRLFKLFAWLIWNITHRHKSITCIGKPTTKREPNPKNAKSADITYFV
jgi:hypothetical protein